MKLSSRNVGILAVFTTLVVAFAAFQNCGQPVNFQNSSPSVDPESVKNIDLVCGTGALDPDDIVYPPFVPLLPPNLPANCSNGFEINNLRGGSYTINSNTAAGARNITLAMDIATYVAPDDLLITSTDSSGNSRTLFHTCRMGTWNAGDPTDGTMRPPDETIRQFRITVPAGTRTITFDYSRVASPTYVRILGLCDFDLLPPQPSIGQQWRLSP